MTSTGLAAFIARRAAESADLWVFAYGSLMWKLPSGCAVARKASATLGGYRRSFCVRSLTYRGSPRRPGLVLGLEQSSPDAACHGVALCLGAASDVQAIRSLEIIDAQEMVDDHRPPVYLRRDLPLALEAVAGAPSATVPAIAYVANASACVPPAMTLSERGSVIATAAGARGTNLEYLLQTHGRLRDLGIHDDHVEALAQSMTQGAFGGSSV